jgi:hypothetical protein
MTDTPVLTRKDELQRKKEDNNSSSNNNLENVPKTTLKIPPDLMLWYKHLALDRNTTVTELVVEAMRAYRTTLQK